MKQFRDTPFPLYDALNSLFEGTVSTGDFAFGFQYSSANPQICPEAGSGQSVRPSCQDTENEFNDDWSSPSHDEDKVPASKKMKTSTALKKKSKTGFKKSRYDTPQPKRVRSSPTSKITNLLEKIVDHDVRESEMKKPSSTIKSESAVHLISKYMICLLDDDELIQAYDVIIDEKKAALFLAMPSTEVRLRWLRHQISQLLC